MNFTGTTDIIINGNMFINQGTINTRVKFGLI